MRWHTALLLRAPALIAGALLLAGCSTDSSPVASCAELPDYDTECSKKTYRYEPAWQEAKTELPATPTEEDLTRVDVPVLDGRYDVFVDRKSVVRGSDGVMRYTVVVQSSSGARNVFHEGLRCLTDEVRTYAFATHGPFQRADGGDWKPLATRGPRSYQEYLANVIMCDRNGYAWDADRALAALSAQYTAGGVRIEAACRDQDHCGYYNRND